MAETPQPEASAPIGRKRRKRLADEVAPAEAPPPRKKRKKQRRGAAAQEEAAAGGAPAAAGGGAGAEEEAAAAATPAGPKEKKRKGVAQKGTAPEEEAAVDAAAAAGAGARKAAATPAGPKDAVDCTVFVDGLPYVWTVEKVEEFFASCGSIVDVRAPTWQDSGRLRGFAHVTFADQAARKKALKLDGAKAGKKGRFLKIEAARPPEERPSAAAIAAGLEGKRRLFVKNLPYDVLEDEVVALFEKSGRVKEVRIPTSFGRSKGFAYVEFQTSQGMRKALQARPQPELRGRQLRLDVDEGNGPRAGFHYRQQAFESNSAPSTGRGRGRGGAGGR